MQFALDLAVEFHQALAVTRPSIFSPLAMTVLASGPEHERLHAFELPYQREKETRAVKIRKALLPVAPRGRDQLSLCVCRTAARDGAVCLALLRSRLPA